LENGHSIGFRDVYGEADVNGASATDLAGEDIKLKT
jgi:hypothetical protein